MGYQDAFEINEKVAYMDDHHELIIGWVHKLYPRSVAVRLNEFRDGKQVIVLRDYDQLVSAI